MKPTPPTPFAIVIDTREQNPLRFPAEVPTVRGTCYPADYTLAGHRDLFAAERKGVAENRGTYTSDLVATITELLRGQHGDTERGSLRFRWELKAMSAIIRNGGVAFVATDRSRSWYAEHRYFGGLRPAALFGAIRSLIADYAVPFLFFDTPADLTAYTLGLAVEIWKHANGLAAYPATPREKPNANFVKWQRDWLAAHGGENAI